MTCNYVLSSYTTWLYDLVIQPNDVLSRYNTCMGIRAVKTEMLRLVTRSVLSHL
jgi:hypothetical protein